MISNLEYSMSAVLPIPERSRTGSLPAGSPAQLGSRNELRATLDLVERDPPPLLATVSVPCMQSLVVAAARLMHDQGQADAGMGPSAVRSARLAWRTKLPGNVAGRVWCIIVSDRYRAPLRRWTRRIHGA